MKPTDINKVAMTIPDGRYSGYYVAYLDVVNDRLKSGRRRLLASVADYWPEIWNDGGREACKKFPDYMLAIMLCQL